MARPSKIPEKLYPVILEWAGEGVSVRTIADKLWEQHHVHVSYGAVQRMLEARRKERGAVIQAVAQEKLAPQVTGDIDRLEAHAARMHSILTMWGERIEQATKDKMPLEDNPELPHPLAYTKMMEQLRKVLETKLEFSGAKSGNSSAAPVAHVFMPVPDPEG